MARRLASLEVDEEGRLLVDDLGQTVRRWISRKQVLAIGSAVVGVALLAAALVLCQQTAPRVSGTHARAQATLGLSGQGRGKSHCHTAVEGESCYEAVRWAEDVGIVNHSSYYGGCPKITADSTSEEFQACLYKLNHTMCPLPCNPEEKIPQTVVDGTTSGRTVHAAKKRPAPCHIAKRGEPCFLAVSEAMKSGIHDRPEKFPGLTAHSTFEEFQTALHKSSEGSSCPRPCQCKTVNQAESACGGHVEWALDFGIQQHPTWYQGLTVTSSFEEVQAYLHKDAKGACPLPCSGITAKSLEEEAAATQAPSKLRASPVACNVAAWPDRVQHATCGESCKALVERFNTHYKTCAGFCQEIGRSCASAATSIDGTSCVVEGSMLCDQEVDEASAICECGETLSGFDAVTPAFAPPVPAPASMPPSVPSQPAVKKKEQEENHCHTASEGSKCSDDVLYGMRTGLFRHPEWYPGLNQFSSFEEFQAILHKNPKLQCPKPCHCETAKKGQNCYDSIQWVLHEGIKIHPEWYPGLSDKSRWEEVQARLHEDKDTTCHTPCTQKVWGEPSIFCWAVFRSEGYELDLVKSQVEKGVGIFSCDEFAVLSDKEVGITDVVKTLIIPPCEEVGVSKDGTAANTLVFMQAWNVISDDVRYKAHDWVIKADPDAVIITQRLRSHLAPYTGRNVWMKNCMKWTGPGWPMMFGSLEAFSHDAMEAYFQGAHTCKTNLEWQAWGEDLFMGNCLSMLGAESEFDGGLIGDNVCKGADCSDGTSASYHPFKSSDDWFECYNQAMGGAIFK